MSHLGPNGPYRTISQSARKVRLEPRKVKGDASLYRFLSTTLVSSLKVKGDAPRKRPLGPQAGSDVFRSFFVFSSAGDRSLIERVG